MKLAFSYNEIKRLATFNGYIDVYGFAKDLSKHVDVDVTYADGAVWKYRDGEDEPSKEDKDSEDRLAELARRLDAVRDAATADLEAMEAWRKEAFDTFERIKDETIAVLKEKAGKWADKQK